MATDRKHLRRIAGDAKPLIEELARLYPDRAPSLGTPEQTVWFDAGAVSVVRFCQKLLQELESSDNILE